MVMERWPSWLKALAWKAGKRESVSRVQIPFSPPLENFRARWGGSGAL